MESISQALVDHGFAVVAAVSLFAALAGTFKFLLGSLLKAVNDVSDRVETRADSTHAVVIQLVDRIRKLEETRLRSLEDSVLRVEMLHRIASELPPDLTRTGRSNSTD